MTEQEIIEGNELIAIFDGWEYGEIHGWITGKVTAFYKKDSKGYIVESRTARGVKYHSSWDWLMPVVEKIESIDDISEYKEGRFEMFIFKRCCDIQTERGDDHIIEITAAKNKITAVWCACVEFIKWYTLQSPQS